jgi:hypothetical protein
MKARGMDLQTIADLTDLSIDDIKISDTGILQY